jgi:hypothetical protein
MQMSENTNSNAPAVSLDWSRLLGFDQAVQQDAITARLGAKVGDKPPPDRDGAHLAKIGAKVGFEPEKA